MGYLAFMLWRADPRATSQERPPVGFWGAIAFQAVNPKALLMALTAAGGFLIPSTGVTGALTMASIFVAVGLPCVALWAFVGDRLRGWLSTPRRAQAFTRGMAMVVAASAVAMALES
jgi:threonine/homoserine/homoserine lactone efflux protein